MNMINYYSQRLDVIDCAIISLLIKNIILINSLYKQCFTRLCVKV